MSQKDRKLVEEAARGNISSFNQLLAQYQGAVYGLAYHWTANFADAEDIVQETLIQAYESLPQLRHPDRFAPWLRTIALNLCRKRHRRGNGPMLSMDDPTHQKIRNQLEDPGQWPDHQLEKRQQQARVGLLLGLLSEKVRLAVTLFYIDALSHSQISQFLGVPVSTIKSRLHKGRLILKEEALKMVEETFAAQPKAAITITKVSGYLHLAENGDGYLGKKNQTAALPDDPFVSRKAIWNVGLEAGDFVEAHLYGSAGKGSRGVLGFDRVNKNPVTLRCSFCGGQTEALVTGPNVQICAACIEASVEVLVRQNGFRLGLTQAAAAHLTPKPAPTSQ